MRAGLLKLGLVQLSQLPAAMVLLSKDQLDAVICNLSGDPSLFSSDCAYSARGTYWWRPEYMFDRFRKVRPLHKWVRRVKK